MSEQEIKGIVLQKSEENLNHIRLYLKRGDYVRAEEAMASFENTYDELLADVELEDFYCNVLALKLEILTRGYTKKDIGYEEERRIAGWYRVMIRLNRLPVKAVRYLFQREDYIRRQKKLDFLETRKILCTDMVCGVLILLFSTMILCGIHELFEELAYFVINGAVFIGSIALLILLWQDSMRCIEAYKSLNDYKRCPVPFERISIF